MTRVLISSLTVNQLKELLRERSLTTTGLKNELVIRLTESVGADVVEITDHGLPSEEIANDDNAHSMADRRVQQQIADLQNTVAQLVQMLQSSSVQQSVQQNVQQNVPQNVLQNEQHNQPLNIQQNDQSNMQRGAAYGERLPTSSTLYSTSLLDLPIPQGRGDIPQITAMTADTINRAQRRDGSVKEIAETLPEFDPTDDRSISVTQFVDRVNASQRAHYWNERGLLLAIYSKLKGAARLWFDSMDEFDTSWEALAQKLIDEFGFTLDEAEVHKKMSRAQREPDEKLNDYCFRVAALGRKHNLSEQAIIRYIREGLRNRELQTAISATKYSSLRTLRDTIDEFVQNAVYLRPQVQPTNKQVRSKEQQMAEKKIEGVERTSVRNVRCFNCNEQGHYAAKCPRPKRRRRCRDCNNIHAVGEPENCGHKVATANRMSVNDQLFTRKAYVNDQEVVAFIDTGSQCSMVKRSVIPRIGGELQKCTLTLKGICGGKQVLNEYVKASLKLDDITVSTKFYVVTDDMIVEDVMIGQDVFRESEVKATFNNGNLEFQCKVAGETDAVLNKVRIEDIDNTTRERLSKLIEEYHDVFATNLSEIGKTDLIKMTISLNDSKPIAQAPYRIPQPKRQVVAEIVKELIENDIVQPSKSAYASPITLVKKKDGSDRLCVDYRRLNAETEKEIFPTPNIEERLQDATKYSLFSTLDLNSGYYQIPVDEESRKYTAFVTPDGLFEFKRMPFGLCNAPAVFQRLMAQLKEKTRPDDMIHYMDDILIGADSADEMLNKLRNVFCVLRCANLTLNPKKCEFFNKSVIFLGHRLTKNGVSPGEAKTKAIQDFKIPENITDIRSFLGLSGYFRRFVPGYAIRSEPLRKLLRKNENFGWGPAQQQAFEDLKKALTSSPVLVPYDVNARHQLHTDASAIGLAAALLQETSNGWKPVAYYSRSTNPSEAKMHSYELETLAVVEGLERFRYYVYGKIITVVTDCSAVKAAEAKRELIPRIARWWLKIQDYQIELKHRSGSRMCHVDALSRIPVEDARYPEVATMRIDRADVTEGDWMYSMQLQDPKIQEIVQGIKSGDKQLTKEFEIKDGRLFRRTDNAKLWVVPRNLVYKVVQDTHERNGHISLDRTIEKIKQLMWFNRMRNVVKTCLKSCIQCAFNKVSGGKIEGEYHFSEIDAVPFRVVHIDHLGPFPRSSRRNEHVLVIVNAFTKYTFIRAVPNTSTKHVIKTIDEPSSFVGMLEKIISDRGTGFTAKEFTKYCQNHLIKHILTAVRTPRANGQVERMNRTILSLLLPMTEKNGKWDEGLRAIQWSINSTVNKTTKQTPHELLFGYRPRDILGNQLILALNDLNISEEKIIDKHNIREIAVSRINLSRGKAKARFDSKHAKPTHYAERDLVLVTNEAASSGASRKLEPLYKGPFIVTKVLDNDRYVVEDLPGSQRKQRHYCSVYASDAMKMWCALPPDDAYPSNGEENDEQSCEDAE